MKNPCSACSGCGVIPDPNRKWWQIFKETTCTVCCGSGHAIPKVRPTAPPSPPQSGIEKTSCGGCCKCNHDNSSKRV